MPISRGLRAGTAAALALWLSACLPLDDLSGGAVTALRVADSTVTVVGPEGYCIDRRSSRDRAAGTVVFLGSCATLAGDGEIGPARPAVLTALVAPGTTPSVLPGPAQVERFFRSDAGRAVLAYDGRSTSVTLQSVRRRGDVVYLNLRDRSTNRDDRLSQTSWRAILPLRNRMVALSVTGHADRPVGSAEARRTLDRFVATMQAANPPQSPGGVVSRRGG